MTFNLEYLADLGNRIATTFTSIASSLTSPLRDVVINAGKGTIFEPASRWIVTNLMPDGGVFSQPLIAWLFGSLVTLFVILTIIKWLIGLIPELPSLT